MQTYTATALPGVPAGRAVTVRTRPGGKVVSTTPNTLTTTAGSIPGFTTGDEQRYVYASVQGFSTVLLRPSSAPLDTPTAGGGSIVVVRHGSTASTPRPVGAAAVYWIGSVTPANMTADDLYNGPG